MKHLKFEIGNLILAILLIFVICTKISAEIILYDDFTVTSGGDINTELGRQSGSEATISYDLANGPVTVTNAGEHAGKAHMDATIAASYLHPTHNFNESGNFTIEFDVTRFLGATTGEWVTCSFGTDGLWKFPHESAENLGMEVLIFQYGLYQVFIPGVLNVVGSFSFPELHILSNQTLKVKIISSQDGFPPKSDARVSLFINDKLYPIATIAATNAYTYDYIGGFTNNEINFITLSSATADLDNFKVTTHNNTISASQGTFSDKVRVNWDSVGGADSYILYRAETNIFSFASVLSNGITDTTFDDTSAALKYYYYWISAKSQIGGSVTNGPVLGYMSAPTGPATPSNISPTGLEEVNAPATLVASDYSGSYPFKYSEWQVSEYDDFSYSYWKSKETIPISSMTISKNSIREGTNYWRVRYMNKFANWSDWSSGASFIYVPGTNGPITFLDSFNVLGFGDVNKDYATELRQSGNASPLIYEIDGITEIGGSAANPGWLTLGPNSGCSPNKNFNESGSFTIEFDVKPHNLDSSADWISIAFGKETKSSFSPISATGLGNLFYADGTFKTYKSSELTGETTGLPTDKPYHVTISVGTMDFENESASYSTFVNNQPLIVDSETLAHFPFPMPLYAYIRGNGFSRNYITFFNNNNLSSSSSAIDNFSIISAPKAVTIHPWTDDSDSLVSDTENFTHKVNIDGDNIILNNVEFIGTGDLLGIINNGDLRITTTNWAMTASGGVMGFDASLTEKNQLDPESDSFNLANSFAFPHGSFGFHLYGLTPNSSNTFYIYTAGFEPKDSGRAADFVSSYGGAIANIDQDTYGDGMGMIVQYDYIASLDGEFTLAISPTTFNADNTPCFHVSAFANVETGQSESQLSVDSILGFGEVLVTRNKVLELDIANVGGGVVAGNITPFPLTSPFTIATNYYSATAGMNDTISVTFEPSIEGFFTNSIILTGTGGTAEVILTGTSVPEPIGFLIFNFGFFIYFIFRKNK